MPHNMLKTHYVTYDKFVALLVRYSLVLGGPFHRFQNLCHLPWLVSPDYQLLALNNEKKVGSKPVKIDHLH